MIRFLAASAFVAVAAAGCAAHDQAASSPIKSGATASSAQDAFFSALAARCGQADDDGWDRSRTWVITRTANGLRLQHDHRHADGSADPVTLYGGETASAGTATRQDFPVDAFSVSMFEKNGLHASVTNIWHIAADDQGFTYGLSRANRDFRVHFDFAKPIAPPPAPWGW